MSEGSIGSEQSRIVGDSSLFMAAHELKSPLALIRQLSLEVSSAELGQLQSEEALKQISLTSERALRLVTDITRTRRLQDTLFELEPINPASLCEEVAHELYPLYKARGRDIRVVKRRNAQLVVAHRELLRRVLLNFGDNALHYADDAPVSFETYSRDSGQRVRIAMRDRGPGVDSHLLRSLETGNLPHVSRRPASSGLGLALSKQFAEAMQGRLGVTRHKDGASFYVELAGSTQTSWL